jgi:hypothetical protein
MNQRDLTKYAYQIHGKGYRAFRYRYHDGRMTLLGKPVAVVIKTEQGYWSATLSGTGMEICIGFGPTRDKAVDDALSSIGES